MSQYNVILRVDVVLLFLILARLHPTYSECAFMIDVPLGFVRKWQARTPSCRGGIIVSMPELSHFNDRNIQMVHFPEDVDSGVINHFFMGLALRQAQAARGKSEVPIGAVVVSCCGSDDAAFYPNKYTAGNSTSFLVLSEAHNFVENKFDASAHAELEALRKGANNIRNWRFPPNSTIYTTLEPCPMCLASIQAFRIDHIVYGAQDNRLGALGTHMSLLQVARHPYHEIKSVIGGVRAEECSHIIVDFFRERRDRNKNSAGIDNFVVHKSSSSILSRAACLCAKYLSPHRILKMIKMR